MAVRDLGGESGYCKPPVLRVGGVFVEGTGSHASSVGVGWQRLKPPAPKRGSRRRHSVNVVVLGLGTTVLLRTARDCRSY